MKLRFSSVIFTFFLFFDLFPQAIEKKPISSKVKIEFRLVEDYPTQGYHKKIVDQKEIYLKSSVEISEKEIVSVAKSKDEGTGYPIILLDLNAQGKDKFASLTKSNVQKKLAILINGKVLLAPTIQKVIAEGKVQLNGSFTEKEIDRIFKFLTEEF